jgi:hypothetical protein
MPSPQRTQTMTPLLIPPRCLRRRCHLIRIRTATAFSRPSRTSMRNWQRYMRCCLRKLRFSFFLDTAIRATCLRSLLSARSIGRVGIRSIALLSALQERMTVHRYGGAQLTTERSRRRCAGEDGTIARWCKVAVFPVVEMKSLDCSCLGSCSTP